MNDSLKLLRVRKGITQSKIASDLGISQATYARLESGQIKLTTDRLTEFADYYDIDASFFLSKDSTVLDHEVQNITNEYLEKLISENKLLRNGMMTRLEAEVNYLRKQNKELLEIINKSKLE